MGCTILDILWHTAEQVPEAVVLLPRDFAQNNNDDPVAASHDLINSVADTDHCNLCREFLRISRADAQQSEAGLRQQLARRAADLLAVVDVVARQLLERPIVERLVQRLVADEVMVR